MKSFDMNTETTYILCPNPECKLFYSTDCFACESDCPHEEHLIKIIKCFCGELIDLPGDNMSWCRVDHTCLNGFTRMLFQRMSGKYQLMYERPEK